MAEQIIESYNASYSLAYYQVGKVYSFYAKKGISQYKHAAVPASEEIVKQYAKSFRGLEDDTFEYSPPGAFGNLVRFYGVVVDLVPGNGNGSYDKIIVMVRQPSSPDAYGLKAYVVNYQGIWTDNREILAPKVSIDPDTFKYPQKFLFDYEFSGQEPVIIDDGSGKGPDHQPITRGGSGQGNEHQPITKGKKSKKEKKNDDSTKGEDISEQVDQVTGQITKMKDDGLEEDPSGEITRMK